MRIGLISNYFTTSFLNKAAVLTVPSEVIEEMVT
jgi:hypothetical protein